MQLFTQFLRCRNRAPAVRVASTGLVHHSPAEYPRCRHMICVGGRDLCCRPVCTAWTAHLAWIRSHLASRLSRITVPSRITRGLWQRLAEAWAWAWGRNELHGACVVGRGLLSHAEREIKRSRDPEIKRSRDQEIQRFESRYAALTWRVGCRAAGHLCYQPATRYQYPQGVSPMPMPVLKWNHDECQCGRVDSARLQASQCQTRRGIPPMSPHQTAPTRKESVN
jgi:hypothetical protein